MKISDRLEAIYDWFAGYMSTGLRWFRGQYTGPRTSVRRTTYASALAILIVYAVMTVYTANSDAVQVRSFLYSMIFLFEAIGTLNIRRGHSYWPAYKFEKALGAVGFAGLAASTGIGLVGNNITLSLWIACIIVAKLTAFEFILRKNGELDKSALNSALGKIPKPDTVEEADEGLTVGAAYYRHGYGSEAARAEYLDAAMGPNISEWAQERRDYLHRRPAEAARLQALGIEVEARDLIEGEW